MKLQSLKLKNFGAFVNFQCEFNDQITHLVGVNGSGKTTDESAVQESEVSPDNQSGEDNTSSESDTVQSTETSSENDGIK